MHSIEQRLMHSVLRFWCLRSATELVLLATAVLLSLIFAIITYFPQDAKWILLTMFVLAPLSILRVISSPTVYKFYCEDGVLHGLPDSVRHAVCTTTMCYAVLVDQYRRAQHENSYPYESDNQSYSKLQFFAIQPTFHELIATPEFPQIPTLSGFEIIQLHRWFKTLSKSTYSDVFELKYS